MATSLNSVRQAQSEAFDSIASYGRNNNPRSLRPIDRDTVTLHFNEAPTVNVSTLAWRIDQLFIRTDASALYGSKSAEELSEFRTGLRAFSKIDREALGTGLENIQYIYKQAKPTEANAKISAERVEVLPAVGQSESRASSVEQRATGGRHFTSTSNGLIETEALLKKLGIDPNGVQAQQMRILAGSTPIRISEDGNTATEEESGKEHKILQRD